ncbi:hypothetical protein LEMLEM_LOCUS21409 [Lemmus lemmus]
MTPRNIHAPLCAHVLVPALSWLRATCRYSEAKALTSALCKRDPVRLASLTAVCLSFPKNPRHLTARVSSTKTTLICTYL